MKLFWKILISVLIFLGGIVLGGWVIATMWNWFIVPLGVVSINIWHAIGIDILLMVLVSTANKGKIIKTDDEENDWFIQLIGILIGAIIGQLILLGLAGIAALLM